MKNELLKLGPITIYGYGLMIAIGIIAAYLTVEYRARKLKLDPEQIFSLSIWAVVGGIIGSKVLYYLTILNVVISHPEILLSFSDGFVVYGGIIGGVAGGYLYCRKAKLRFLKYFDLVIPSVALAQGFGRIGCFLAGCCYGRETGSVFGIVFHESAFAPNNISLIPTQLISSALDFLNFFALIIIARKAKADGQVAAFYMIFYSIGRFMLEYYRGDLDRGNVGSFSTSQFISIFILFTGLAVLLFNKFNTRKIREHTM
jgi:phosphatidylglycerol:prolipoprotein diacylglycerol transferase